MAVVTLAKVVTIVVSVGGAVLISYPFMSGSDRGRFQFTVFLFVATILGFLIVSGIRKLVADQISVSVALFSKNVEKYASRIEDIEKKLSHVNQKLVIVKNFVDIEYNGSSMFLIVEDEVLSEEKFASTLLEQRIQGSSIVHFVDSYADITGRIPLEFIDHQWLIEHTSVYSQNPIFLRISRMVDLIVGALLSFILFIPILLIGIVVKLESKGPIFFKQERLGKNKLPFILYKFRSMTLDAESGGPQWATKSDSRVTKVGGFLRTSHLDELPQLLNLLKGDLTLVGPRPIRKYFADKLTLEVPYYALRFLVKPGITGWAQVKGPYGSNMKEQREKFEMDLYYILKSNLVMNVYIILSTVKTLSGR